MSEAGINPHYWVLVLDLKSSLIVDEPEVMEQAVLPSGHCPLSLRNVLLVHEQPVCEEQAWALCYQLCALLERNFSLHNAQRFSSWRSLRLPGPDGIFLCPDGNVFLRIEHGNVGKMARAPPSLPHTSREPPARCSSGKTINHTVG